MQETRPTVYSSLSEKTKNPWIKHWGHKNKENDHQLKKLMTVKQILHVSTLGIGLGNSTEDYLHTDV